MPREQTPAMLRKQRKAELERDYVVSSVAEQATGLSGESLLRWCEENNVSHMKYLNKWRYHYKDLLRAIQAQG